MNAPPSRRPPSVRPGPTSRSRPPSARATRRRDTGRFFARVLCFIFAFIGVVPLALGVLVRTSVVRAWAAEKTSALVARELGVDASYSVAVQAWPLLVALDDVRVASSDGLGPFLEVERVAVRPRLFSLLAGEVDAGDVEIVGPRVRAVVAGGELKNLHYKLPASAPKTEEKGPPRLPFASLAVTDARVDLTVDGAHVVARQVDVDVSNEGEGRLEVGVRAGTTAVTRVHPVPGFEDTEDAVDEDVLCSLDARVHVEPGSVLVRRLIVEGAIDYDPDPGTAPTCSLATGDTRGLSVRLSGLMVRPHDGTVSVGGRVRAKVPVAIAHRFVLMPHATGSVTLDADVDWDGISKLPKVHGQVTAEQPGLDGKVFASELAVDVDVSPDGVVLAKHLVASWGDGKVIVSEAKILPFAKGLPLTTGPITIEGIEFPSLLRDLGVHPQAHVAWTLEKGRFEHFDGTLDPVSLDGPLTVTTRHFEILNRPIVEAKAELKPGQAMPYPGRGHMVGVHDQAIIKGVFQVRPQAVVLNGFSIDTARSHLRANVTLAFRSWLDIDVAEGSKVDLAELSPIVDVPIAGVVTVHAHGVGDFDHPKFTGDLSIQNFAFGGFPVGDVESTRVAFEPLVLDFLDAHIKHGPSRAHATLARIAFDKGHDVLIDADVDTHETPHMRSKDFLEVFRFDKDPRFESIDGIADGHAHVHFALNGPEDRCGGGLLDVRASAELEKVALFGETYAGGSLDMSFRWDDALAGDLGMNIDVRSMSLRKGTGSILGSVTVRHGGVLTGSAIATGLPVSSIDALGALGKQLDGTAMVVADIGGTTSAIRMNADVSLSRLRIGPSSLPGSRVRFAMEPHGEPRRFLGKTRCGNDRPVPFDPESLARDTSDGVFRLDGQLFDGEVKLSDVTITQQKHKVLAGRVDVTKLDLGTLANLLPGVAFGSGSTPHGFLSARVDVKSFPVDAPSRADVTLSLDALEVERDKNTARLLAPSGPIVLRDNLLRVPELRVEGRGKSGLSAVFVAGGKIANATTAPDLDLAVDVEPIDLSRLPADIPGVDRAAGTFEANLAVKGPLSQLKYTGAAHLRKGEISLKSQALDFDDVNVDVDIEGGDVRVKRVSARLGGGTIEATARLPLRGRDAGLATARITARGVKVPVADGVNLTADADLDASYALFGKEEGAKNLPDVKGTVSLTSFSYTRPIVLSLDLSQLGKATRANVTTYDPDNDVVRFTLNVVSPHPLRFSNNLVDMKLEVVEPGLLLSGTNQRFGARGQLKVLPDSKLVLRNNEFKVREGNVRFDDPTRIAPKVDVRAQTEYRRYSSSAAQDNAASATEGAGATSLTNPGATTAAASVASNGTWRINMHAHGDAENLRVDLTSDPVLSQQDIVLLLTVGMTSAELAQSSSSLGESVGLEAVSSLTGADQAVAKAVPVIDSFQFGSWYSSLAGQIEPTVTLGKRVSDNLHGTVTTGVTDNREVRSNLQWQLTKRMSLEGTYDNLNEVSTSGLGNVGADLRWHIEFE